MIKLSKFMFWAVALLLSTGCASCSSNSDNGGEEPQPTPPTPPAEESCDVEAYVTSENLAYRFTKIDTKFASVSMSPSKIKLDPTETYQDIDGFGAALTGSSCYNLMKMSAADRARFLKETFDPEEGMGFSFIRMHIGGSDFSMDEYTCCDKEGIEFFEIPQIEREGIFPVLREIMAINPELKIMGSPWSCPRWMKVNPNTMKAPYIPHAYCRR